MDSVASVERQTKSRRRGARTGALDSLALSSTATCPLHTYSPQPLRSSKQSLRISIMGAPPSNCPGVCSSETERRGRAFLGDARWQHASPSMAKVACGHVHTRDARAPERCADRRHLATARSACHARSAYAPTADARSQAHLGGIARLRTRGARRAPSRPGSPVAAHRPARRRASRASRAPRAARTAGSATRRAASGAAPRAPPRRASSVWSCPRAPPGRARRGRPASPALRPIRGAPRHPRG